MWSLEFVQVASDALLRSKQKSTEIAPNSSIPASQPLSTPKSPIEHLRNLQPQDLQDLIELGSSADSTDHLDRPNYQGGSDDDALGIVEPAHEARDSMGNNRKLTVHVGENGASSKEVNDNRGYTGNQSPAIDFEIVSESEVTQALDSMKQHREQHQGWKAPQILREGFVWQKQLVFRSKLTMHTAFERKDNKEPAAVTCISVSK